MALLLWMSFAWRIPKISACAVDASRSCRSRRYPLTPLTMVVTLSSPGSLVQHSTARRVATFDCDNGAIYLPDAKTSEQGRTAVSARTCWRCCDGKRLRGRCLAFVPKSPVSTGTTNNGDDTFVSRPSRSTFHPASRCYVYLCQDTERLLGCKCLCVGEDRCALPWFTCHSRTR